MPTTPLTRELMDIAMLHIGSVQTRLEFIARISEGKLIRSQNQRSHVCVYFVLVKQSADGTYEALIGYHKKAKQFLPPGGHNDFDVRSNREEKCIEAVKRELFEEFGVTLSANDVPNPFWLTTTTIKNEGQLCKKHFDVWYVFNIGERELTDNNEFEELAWVPFSEMNAYLNDKSCRDAMVALSCHLSVTAVAPIE